jgi:hypothetical protein
MTLLILYYTFLRVTFQATNPFQHRESPKFEFRVVSPKIWSVILIDVNLIESKVQKFLSREVANRGATVL